MRATSPGQPAHLLLDVLDVLTEMDVPCALVGALAVSYYGIPRSTSDADAAIWLDGTGKSRQDVAAAIRARGFFTELRQGEIDDPILGVILVKDIYQNRADLLLGIRGMDPDTPHRCVSSSLLDSSVRIVGIEDLIAMKVSAGGPQDLKDVRGILRVSGTLIDRQLLRSITGRYGDDAVGILDKLLANP